MRTNAMHNGSALAGGPLPRRRRPDHPEDYGRGPWWRLAELLLLGFTFPSPPPVTRLWPEDDEKHEA
jgi:hypothetical protein